MQNIVNEVRVSRGARLGKIATFGGLGFLVVGLIVSLVMQNSPVLFVAFLCLLLGLIVSTVGTSNMNRWVREPRADQSLAQGLKGFDERFRLYNYFLPAPHVLLAPTGLWVLTALGQDGVIRFEGGKFHRKKTLGRALRFMADEGLGRPFAEADSQVQALRALLDKSGVGEGVEIQSILVFYNPRAELVVSEPPRPVTNSKGLKRALRRQPGEKLSGEQYRSLQELFDQATA
jgi:hypothetical protein